MNDYISITDPKSSADYTIAPSLTQRKRAELWRAFTGHLIGLATVLWWVWFKEAPPK